MPLVVRRRIARPARLVLGVAAGQTAAQALTAVTGLLLVHWLTTTQYAQYAFAFAFSTTVAQLADLGWADSMFGVIGANAHDLAVVGSVMRAAMSLRWLFCGILVPVSAVAFFVLAGNHPWALGTEILLFLAVMITLVTRTYSDYFVVPLILGRRFRALYSATILAAVGRMAGTAVLKVVSGLTGSTAALLNGFGFAVTGLGMWLQTRKSVPMPSAVSSEHRAAILRIALPTLPSQIFFALQGQITIFLIALTGTDTNLASLGALTRLGAGFGIITTVVAYLVIPRVARASHAQVRREVALGSAAVAAVGALVTTAAFLVPSGFTFVLGHRYADLDKACSWFILAGSLGTLGAYMNGVTITRGYTWWWASLLQVGAILVAEIGGALLFRLSSVLELQYWTIGWEVAWLAVQAALFSYGRRHDAPSVALESGGG